MTKTAETKFVIVIFTLLAIGLFVYIQTTNTKTQASKIIKPSSRLQIVTSFYPLYFFTTQIVQDKADVHNITPAGAEPHDYEPTTRDMVKIENSRLLIINGAKLEGWAEDIKNILSGRNTTILSVGEKIANLNTMEGDIQIRDPHIWLNPVLAKKEIEIITESLIMTDPANSQFYADNAKVLIGKLEILNNQFRTELSTCQKKDIITAHAAFEYLAKEYGLKQTAISGLSPDEEPSPKKLAEVAKFAEQNQVDYIFFESLVSPKLASTIAEEIGAKTLVLNPIEGLTDEEIKNGKTYFTEMQNNLINLKIALQCL